MDYELIIRLKNLLSTTTYDELYKQALENQIDTITNEEEATQMYELLLQNQQSIRDGIYYSQKDILKFLRFRFGNSEKKGIVFL